MMPRDWLDARFERLIAKQDREKTGLVKTGIYMHICTKCGASYSHHVPRCTMVDELGRTCGCSDVQWMEVIGVEAMPIGRITKIDMRSEAQRKQRKKQK